MEINRQTDESRSKNKDKCKDRQRDKEKKDSFSEDCRKTETAKKQRNRRKHGEGRRGIRNNNTKTS